MDDDLEAIVSIPWELEGESCSSNIVEELTAARLQSWALFAEISGAESLGEIQ